MTVLLASALPVTRGWASSVTSPLYRSSCTAPTSSYTDTMVGLGGGVVDTVKPKASDGALRLPAWSTAFTVMVCTPLFSAVVGVQVQLPDASTGTRLTSTPLS
ncbi:hypothetical protein D3C71_1078870 [compost metagenome]